MGEKAVNQVHQFLETIAKEIRSLMQRICEERIKLSSSVSQAAPWLVAQQPLTFHGHMTVTWWLHAPLQLIAVRGAAHYVVNHSEKMRQKDRKNLPQVVVPGLESERKDRGEPTRWEGEGGRERGEGERERGGGGGEVFTDGSAHTALPSTDLLMQKLIHLCWTLNHYTTISVWEHTFRPREYLTPHLEEIFIA